MLTEEPTREMLEEWKRIFKEHHASMTPNRKTGAELDRYFREKYSFEPFDDPVFLRIVALNITENAFSRSKLPPGTRPDVRGYRVGAVLVGIDLPTGEFYVECEDMEKAVPLYDDLFVYRGLDAADLENFFLVAEYVRLSQNG